MRELTGLKILVVEDDPRMCESILHLLNFNGYGAQASTNLYEALNSLMVVAFDLVLLDLQLGDQSGFVIMDYLAVKKVDTPVIIFTGQQSETAAITAVKKGAADYLKKPIEPDTLLKSVAHTLDLRKQRYERELTYKIVVSSRDRFRRVVDSQNDYLCRLNREFEVTFANKAFADTFSATPPAMIGRSYKTLIQDSIQHALFEKLDAVRSGSKPIKVEFTFMRQSGPNRYQRWRFQGISDELGHVEEIQCVGRDVTREKLLQVQLEAKTEKFRDLSESNSDWIWEVDNQGVYTYASPVVADLLGYRPEEVLGKQPFAFMPAEEAQRQKRAFQEMLAGRKPFKNIENINLHKNGECVTLESSGVAIVDESETVVGYRGVTRDISIRKRAEQRLHEESIKLKESLAKVKRLSGMLPICASCKKIRDDSGSWKKIEVYIERHSEAEFTHGICPQCARELYPELYKDGEAIEDD